MLVKSLDLNDYRNYHNYHIEFDPKLNIIIGKNGVGKTNILESIIVVSNTKSYRTSNDSNLINHSKDYARIQLNSDEGKFKVVINKDNKSLFLNNQIVKKTSNYIGLLNAILFKPDDLQIFYQSPSDRRKILDIEIGKVDKEYLNALLKYNSLLKDKNKLLKQLEPDETLLSVINESMVSFIEIIIKKRKEFFNEINKYLTYYYFKFSNEDKIINIEYKNCCEEDEIIDKIKNSKEKDNYYHYTTFGPHHDDYEFLSDDNNLNNIASQGQKRLVLIAFKFALIKYIQFKSNKTPIVLLDDILSELDKNNQERLLNNIPNNCQVIITNTELNNLNIKNYKLIEIKEEDNG